MNISSEIFRNSSHHLFFNDTGVVIHFRISFCIDLISFLCGVPINSYVIWLIVRGTGNGVASEFFSLNLTVCEMFFSVESFLGFLCYKFTFLMKVVYFLDGIVSAGRALFQCLICLERYLAVVHPVTFLKYKPLRYRMICSAIVWVASFVSCWISFTTFMLFVIKMYFVYLCAHFLLFLFPQLFCCLAVLKALKQSGPGERGREKEEENHMKRRAFFIILISNVSMICIYAPYIIVLFINIMSDSEQKLEVLMAFCYLCFSLAGFVQPLLFLYRVGKLPFIKY